MRIELCENVVSTDYIEGTTLHYFTYATEWTDTEHALKFKTLEQAIEWYEKHLHGRVVAQGECWLREDGVENYTDEDAVDEWRTIIDCVAYC